MHAALFLGCCIAPTGCTPACCLLLCCLICLAHYPRRSNGPALVAVANANALQVPMPPKPSWPVSPVLWVLRHAVGHPRQHWDPWDRARQEPLVGARCLVTPVDGMISGYDYDYGGIFALRAHCTRTARYFCTMFPPKSPQAHPLETPLELGDPSCPSSRKLQTTFP